MDIKTKAYFVCWDDDWGMFIHATSPGNKPTLEYIRFTELEVRRHPKLDGVPFTDDVFRAAGYPLSWIEEEENYPMKDGWLDFCRCSMCGNVRHNSEKVEQEHDPTPGASIA